MKNEYAKTDFVCSTCQVCKQKMYHLFSVPCDYRRPDVLCSSDVYWCTSCDFGQVYKRPSRTEAEEYYKVDDYYTHSSSTRGGEKSGDFWDRLRMHIAWRIDRGVELEPKIVREMLSSSDIQLCEIGCGNGSNLAKFKENGFVVSGVEPDPVARTECKRIFEVHNGTAEELPEELFKKEYDVVLMSHVLEHCIDINLAVENARKLLKESGLLIIETPNNSCLGFSLYKGEWPWSDIPRHLNFFTPSSLRQVLVLHNFKIMKKDYRGFCRQFSNSWLRDQGKISIIFSGANKSTPLNCNYKNRAWKQLLISLFVTKASKYDSVRYIAMKS